MVARGLLPRDADPRQALRGVQGAGEAPLKLAIVGGGITGLAAAHRAVELARERKTDLELTLFEARERPGGTIATERADGFVLERGPDSFLTEKPAALALCRRLGIAGRLVRTDDRYRKTYVWSRRTLHALPDGFQLLAPTRLMPFATSRLFSWRGKLRMALDTVLPRGDASVDESLAGFVRRRLGQEALDRVAEPLVGGIYAADPDELSVKAAIPHFRDLEQRERSLILGLWRASRRATVPNGGGPRWSLFVSFRDGMSELVDALAAQIPARGLRTGAPVRAIHRDGEGWRVVTDGDATTFDRVIVATEAHAAGRALAAVDTEAARSLLDIPYAGAATVSLGYARADVAHALDAFGFVVPATERRALLACTFSSVKYPGRAPDGTVLLRAFVARHALGYNDATLIERVRGDLGEALGITAEPKLVRLHRHRAAMPQYVLGHLDRMDAIDRRIAALPGLVLAGAGYRGLGIAECVRSGEAAAEQALGAASVPESALAGGLTP